MKVNNSKQKFKNYKEIVISPELYSLLLEQQLKLGLNTKIISQEMLEMVEQTKNIQTVILKDYLTS